MAFPEDIQSNTPAKYLFKLVSDTQTVICNPEPLDWRSGTLEITRDLEVGGVFSSFQQDSLTFVGNGAELLKNLFDTYEVNAVCTLIIYWWKGSVRNYVEFPSRFSINFNFYERVKVGRFVFGVKVKAVNNSTQTKLDNRQEIPVDITKRVTIGGVTVNGYGNEDAALKKRLQFAATNVQYNSKLAQTGNNQPLNRLNPGITYSSVQIDVQSNDILGLPETTTVSFVTQKTELELNQIPSFFKEAQFTKDLTISYGIFINVTNRHVGTFPWELEILETRDENPTGSKVNTTIVNTYSLGGVGGIKKVYYLSGTETITVTKGNSLKLVVRRLNIEACAASLINGAWHVLGVPAINEWQVSRLSRATWQEGFITINQTIILTEPILTEGFPLYEAIERNCQHILDIQYPIYSQFFGRTDVVYNEYGAKYITENQLRFAHVQTGLNQRGQKLTDPDSIFTLNFKDLFKSIQAIWNVGYSLEQIGSTLRIRIEEYAHFFQDVEALNISDRINKYDIESSFMPELVPVSVNTGFDSYEYLSVNGRAEPNTTNQRTTPMNTATKLDIVSVYRGDTKGMLNNIATPIVAYSEDGKGDSDKFIVKSQRDSTYDWKPEKDENISVDENTSLFEDDLLNRYFTPTRILIRNGNRITCGMTKYMSSVLRFQNSDKTSTLKTTETGEDQITENADVLISDLGSPIYKAMKHKVNCQFDFTDLAAIQATPFGYIKFSDTISGFLLSLKKKNAEDRAEIIIIEKF